MTNNPTVRAIAAGIAAALVALGVAYASGDGVSAGEWITVALAFLTGSGLVTVAENRAELKRTRNKLDTVRHDARTLQVYGDTALDRRLSELETAVRLLENPPDANRETDS